MTGAWSLSAAFHPPILCHYFSGVPDASLADLLKFVSEALPPSIDSLTIRGVMVEFSDLTDCWEMRVFYDQS